MSQSGFGDEIKFPKIQFPRVPSGTIRGVIIGIIALIVVVSSFYTIAPEEMGPASERGLHVVPRG